MTNVIALRKVDQTGLKTGQVLTILMLLAAFVLDAWPLVAAVALCQLCGALNLPFGPYRVVYQNLLKPSGVVKPNIQDDNPEPHQFAMLVGAIFNALGVVAILAGSTVLGWALVWVVIVLANVNFWLNFCLGCWFYYQFNRLGIPWFEHAPLKERG